MLHRRQTCNKASTNWDHTNKTVSLRNTAKEKEVRSLTISKGWIIKRQRIKSILDRISSKEHSYKGEIAKRWIGIIKLKSMMASKYLMMNCCRERRSISITHKGWEHVGIITQMHQRELFRVWSLGCWEDYWAWVHHNRSHFHEAGQEINILRTKTLKRKLIKCNMTA